MVDFNGCCCPFCQTVIGAPGFVARSTYLWSNQFGYSKRIFCKNCNRWTDYKDIGDKLTITRWKDERDEWHETLDFQI